jgi:peptidoglycan/LPS O-acetylase OafA/YrhL
VSWLERHLSRSTSSGAFIPEVDGMRFLAILGVLIVHTAGDLYFVNGAHIPDWSFDKGLVLRLMGGGWFGVQIFFVLSGFIVSLPFAKHRLQGTAAPDLRRYLLRRLTRIEPPYIIALTLFYLASGKTQQLLYNYLAGLVYSHHYIFTTLNPVAQITWSLEVEVTFYILAPWLTLVYCVRGNYRRWLLQLALIVLPAAASVYWLVPHGPARIQNTLVVMIQYFFAGILLADLYASGLMRRSAVLAWDLGAIGAAVALGSILCGMPDTWNWYWVTPVLIMLLFAGIFKGRFANRLFRVRAITIVGGMCYTLYLSHMAVIGIIAYQLKPLLAGLSDVPATVAYCLLVLPIMIAVSVPIYLLIEKPFMTGNFTQLRGWLPYRAAESA